MFSLINSASSGNVIRWGAGGATYGLGYLSADTNGVTIGDINNSESIYFNYATNYLAFKVSASEKMRLTSAGYLGIGTSSPATNLEVRSSSATTIKVAYTGNTGTELSAQASGESRLACNSTNGYLTFYTGGTPTENLRLDSSGNLGLGVTPSAWNSSWKALQLTGGSLLSYSGADRIILSQNAIVSTGGPYTYVNTNPATSYSQNSGVHSWNIASSGTAGTNITFTQAMTLDNSGNLGIGTTSPSSFYNSQLVVGSEASSFGSITLATTSTGSNSIFFARSNSGAGRYRGSIGYDQTSDAITFRNAGDQERMRIDSSGNVLVGATSTSGGAKLYVKGSGSSNAAARFYNADLTDSNFTLYVDKPSTTTTTSQVFIGFTVNAQTAGSGQINANGASQAAFGSFSDARLKENIVDLPSQLANIMALHPVEFDYIASEGGGHQIGFVAQEIEKVYPNAVGERADGMKTVTGWNKTEAILVKAIQELSAKVTALEAKLGV
jgi:hypothetical protein